VVAAIQLDPPDGAVAVMSDPEQGGDPVPLAA